MADRNTDEDYRNFYGNRIGKIYKLLLPYELCFYGSDSSESPLWTKSKYNIRQLISKLRTPHKLDGIIKQEGYDFVYLNSLTLFPLINDRNPFFLHVREIAQGNSAYLREISSKISNARGTIYIDHVTRNSLQDDEGLVLNNPVDMRSLGEINSETVHNKYHLNKDKITFTVLGTLSEFKGVGFIIESFITANRHDATLLIVGNNNTEYGNHCKALCANQENVVFIDELQDPAEIYRVTDYVLRGESLFAIGRTVYEGLYSGCHVILPGSTEYRGHLFEYENFSDKILFYKPGDRDELIQIITSVPKLDQTNRKFRSNVDQYVKDHTEYLKKCLDR